MSTNSAQLKAVALEISGHLREASFVKRLTRFSCLVNLDGQQIQVHFPNSGRHGELLVPGRKVILRKERAPGRKTDYDLIMARHGSQLVSVDARVPNKLFQIALNQGAIADFCSYQRITREVRRGRTRLDFLLQDDAPPLYIEVKSVTLIQKGRALFPDAPTTRGQRHLEELMAIVAEGARAANIFIIQREDARYLSPNDEADPQYGKLLRKAAAGGVRILAYTCQVTPNRIQIDSSVPIKLD